MSRPANLVHNDVCADDDLRVNLARAEQLRKLQHENHQLNTVMIKMKAMHAWRRNHLTNNFLKTVSLFCLSLFDDSKT